MDESNGLLPGDKLTLFCEVSVVQDSINIHGHSNCHKLKVPECSLVDDLGNLLEQQVMTDVTFEVDGVEIKAHKAIISARSEVFRRMFCQDSGFKEATSDRVEIKDLEQDVFQELLKFIYTGKVEKLQNMADDLLAAADRYQLDRLKTMCEEHLSLNLNIDNAASVLMLADLHSAVQLKQLAIQFCNANTNEVTETDAWKQMEQSAPRLVCEAYKVLGEKNQPNQAGAQNELLSSPPRKRIKSAQN